MRVTVFTSNQARHLSLVESLSGVADEVCAVMECTTAFPGQVEDFFRKSDIMREYFGHMLAAQERVFGKVRFSAPGARILAIKMGDLNRVGLDCLDEALKADVFVVFGASYIKAPLIDILVERRAYNIHMGVSPYYRGSSCNFWALYDKHPEMVGATIHLLGKGLDSGPMLFHALPAAQAWDPWDLGMAAVKSAHRGLVELIASGEIHQMKAVEQDKSQEIRYTRNQDFNDQSAQSFLDAPPSPEQIQAALEARDLGLFLRPQVG